jgi:hypothetical protein
VNGFDPEAYICAQDTISPDWLHPGGSAASEAPARAPNTAATVTIAAARLR